MPMPKEVERSQIRITGSDNRPVEPKRDIKVVKVHRENPQFLEKALQEREEE